MVDLSRLKISIAEKQEIILGGLGGLSYDELIHMIASLSSIVTNLERFQAEEEVQCNLKLVKRMIEFPRETFSKSNAYIKSTEVYLSYKTIAGLKRCAERATNIIQLHINKMDLTKQS